MDLGLEAGSYGGKETFVCVCVCLNGAKRMRGWILRDKAMIRCHKCVLLGTK